MVVICRVYINLSVSTVHLTEVLRQLRVPDDKHTVIRLVQIQYGLEYNNKYLSRR